MKNTPIIIVFIAFLSAFGSASAESTLSLISGGIKNVKKSWGPHCPPTQQTETDKSGSSYQIAIGASLKPLKGSRPLFGPRICQQATGLPSLKEERSQTLITCRSAPNAPRQVMGRITRTETPTQMVIQHAFTYNWRLHGSHCQLESTGKWVLGKKTKAPTKEPVVKEAKQPMRLSGPTPPNKTTQSHDNKRCSQGRIRIKAQVVDKNGCKLSRRIKWSASHGQIDRRGLYNAKKTTPKTAVKVTARRSPPSLVQDLRYIRK